MKRSVALALIGAAVCCPLLAQDAMQYGLKFQNVLGENDKVRVVHYTPQPGTRRPSTRIPTTWCTWSRVAG